MIVFSMVLSDVARLSVFEHAVGVYFAATLQFAAILEKTRTVRVAVLRKVHFVNVTSTVLGAWNTMRGNRP